MSDFVPCLEVISVPLRRVEAAPWPLEFAEGARLPLEDGAVVGREIKARFRVPMSSVGRQHVRFEFKHARWWVLELGTANGTFLNGLRFKDAELRHGDVLELPFGFVLRVLLQDSGSDTNVEMERELLEFPDDEARWSVWADWLLERGVPLGRRLSTAERDPDDDARALGTMATFFREGWLEPEWRHGFPVSVVVRDPGNSYLMGGLQAGLLLELLFREPAFRFVRRVEVDLVSFVRTALWAQLRTEVEVLGDVLAEAKLPRWLTAVRVGPMPIAELKLVQALPVRLEFFVAPHASLEVLRATPSLKVHPAVGRSVGLTTEEPNVIARLDEATVRIESAAAVQIVFQQGRWRVEDLRGGEHLALRLNGRPSPHGTLRDGDLIEIFDELSLRFRMR